MTKDEFDAMRKEPSPAGLPAAEVRSVEREVLRIITPHLPRCCELLIHGVQSGNVEAAMALAELWRWARSER
jgi:hypothetical protein